MHRDESNGRCSEITPQREMEVECSLLQKMEDVALPIKKKEANWGLK